VRTDVGPVEQHAEARGPDPRYDRRCVAAARPRGRAGRRLVAADGPRPGHPDRPRARDARGRCGSAGRRRGPRLVVREAAARVSPWVVAAAARPASALLAVALLLPRVRVVVVAVALPEAEPVLAQELEPPDPLRALPEVAPRDDEAQRPAVLELERLAAERVGQEDVVVVEHLARQVRRVALLGVGDDEARLGSHLGQPEDLL